MSEPQVRKPVLGNDVWKAVRLFLFCAVYLGVILCLMVGSWTDWDFASDPGLVRRAISYYLVCNLLFAMIAAFFGVYWSASTPHDDRRP